MDRSHVHREHTQHQGTHGALFAFSSVDKPLQHVILCCHIRRDDTGREMQAYRLSLPIIAWLVLEAFLNYRSKMFLTAPDTLRHVSEETPCDPEEGKD